MAQCDELVGLAKGPAKRKAQGIRRALENSMPFIRDSMREFLKNTADDAKTDVDHFITDRLKHAGLKHLTDLTNLTDLPGQPALHPFTPEKPPPAGE